MKHPADTNKVTPGGISNKPFDTRMYCLEFYRKPLLIVNIVKSGIYLTIDLHKLGLLPIHKFQIKYT